jgi:hypothetical protein
VINHPGRKKKINYAAEMIGPVPPFLHTPSRWTKLFVIYVHSAVDFSSLSGPSQTRSHAFLPLLLRQFTRPLISKQTKVNCRWITSVLTITGERYRSLFEMLRFLDTNNFTIATTKQIAAHSDNWSLLAKGLY